MIDGNAWCTTPCDFLYVACLLALLLPDLRHMVGVTSMDSSLFRSINLFFQLESVSFSINYLEGLETFFCFWLKSLCVIRLQPRTLFLSIQNTNVMHLILFIRQIFSSTCFEYQVLIFRRIQLYVSSIWYHHSL